MYGIFESRIYFPRKEGTSAYFELRGGNGVPCEQGGLYENEIFIANSWWRQLSPNYHLSHRINHYHTGTDCVDDFEFVNDKSYPRSSSDTYFIYKCIWTPSFVRYYLDGTLMHEVLNTGSKCPGCNQEWFPEYPMYLSFFQILNHDVELFIEVPQTTYIDFVSVKKFFATPEITLSSDVICTNGSATINTDSDASNITWTLSPSGLFTGATSGSGKIASINAGSAMGEGKITYSFEMPSGETFEVEKTFYIGAPDPADIDFINVGPYYPGSMILCNDMPNDGIVDWGSTGSIQEYSWSVYDDGNNYWQVIQHPMDPFPAIPMQDVQFSKPYGSVNGYVNVIVKARNTCGWGAYSAPAKQFSTTTCSGYFLFFTPNPTSGETTLSIETNSSEKTFDETAQWDLEVYSETQLLKTKQTGLRGQSTKIQTAGWKDGVYLVRVKYNDEILTGKLIVKR
jgi:hypothetical protein